MMIVKEKDSPKPTDPRGMAGYEAEKQTAFILRRAFAESPDVLVFNDVAFERAGERAQIDHLVMHRFGFAILESKSITGTVEVNQHLEFVRTYDGRRGGMRSPIEQARLQMRLLQALLNDSKEYLRPKKAFGLVQPHFSDQRFQTFVAISDRGIIERKGVDPPELMKLERIVKEIIRKTIAHQQTQGASAFVKFMSAGKEKSEKILEDYVTAFSDKEFELISEFLMAKAGVGRAVQQSMDPMPATITPVLVPVQVATESSSRDASANEAPRQQEKVCEAHELEILYGRYGYYFRCRKCDDKKTVPQKCEVCGAKAKLRKQGADFYRDCDSCGTPRLIHQNPAAL